MQQVYYTQCPLGYGLGATSGFQIKRLDPGYPTSGDFRHFALRAFLPGSRTLVPPALRYRREGSVAEIAWLTPRTHEYETENGRLWGRPGGQFAHGLRLDPEEFAALSYWPAGLHDAGFWVRSDPERTNGRPPDSRQIGPGDLRPTPRFDAVAPLLVGIAPEIIARLLTGLARAAAEGRTLVLIAEADALWRLIAALTFAFPEPLRSELTFSTYHDRPEELSGFRLQGTLPSPRMNRAHLSGLGIVADLAAGTFEPGVVPAGWARTLAGWLSEPSRRHTEGWERTAARLDRLPLPVDPRERWSEAWLDPVFLVEAQLQRPAPIPKDAEGWASVLSLVRWSARHGLAEPWVAAHDPSWWRVVVGGSGELPVEGRAALVAQARLPETWRLPAAGLPVLETRESGGASSMSLAAEWGEIAASAFRASHPDEQFLAARRLLKSATATARGTLLASLVRGLGPEAGGQVVERLGAEPDFDPSLLLPVEAARRATVVVEGGDAAPLFTLVREALDRPATAAPSLSAIAECFRDHPGRVDQVAAALAVVLDSGDVPGWDNAWRWALSRDDAVAWLRPFLRRLFEHPDRPAVWEAARERTPASLLPSLARCVLDVAREPGAPSTAFRWGVERLLLTIEPGMRPGDAAWPDALLARLSGLDLVRRLFLRKMRDRPLTSWLADAGQRGEIGPEQAARLREARAFAQVLEAGDARGLGGIAFPAFAPEDRGAALKLILQHVADEHLESLLTCLDALKAAWGRAAFEPGESGIESIGEALSNRLDPHLEPPDRWLTMLGRIVDRLDLRPEGGGGYEPDSLAAQIVATAGRSRTEPVDLWSLRQAVFRREETWRALSVVLRSDLTAPQPGARSSPLARWNDALERPTNVLESRFHELMLNVAATVSPAMLREVVRVRVPEFRTLDRTLPWWGHEGVPGSRDEIRDAFARLVPLEPLPAESLPAIRSWLRSDPNPSRLELDLDPVDQFRGSEIPGVAPEDFPCLSHVGWARWRCLDALTVAARPGLADEARWQSVENWIHGQIPLSALEIQERYRFVAEMIRLLNGFDPNETRREQQLSVLARWLVVEGVRHVSRVRDWPRDLAHPPTATTELVRARRPMVGALVRAIEEEQESLAHRASRDA